jgi:hypothetical protein
MTGQVKEEILTRRGELGIGVAAGKLSFAPYLLRAGEFVEQPAQFDYLDVDGKARAISLDPGSLAFTLCQVPVVYELADGAARIRIAFADGSVAERPGAELDVRLSAEILSRGGKIASVRVAIPRETLTGD